ncbi:MAG: molybdate ABC transporter substrate-binding protein [Acidimicrobiales bacterium]|nr:molybdate ABC transporter substrate-binding protein [Acidimicrobiales bacterium]
MAGAPLLVVAAACAASTDAGTSGSATSNAGTSESAPSNAGPSGSVTPVVTSDLTVSAAASLTAPFDTIGDELTSASGGAGEVTFSFDSSSTLATQIIDGAPADVFAAADEASMARLVDAGMVRGEPRVFARNQLAIVVKAGNPTGIASLADLASADVVALCGEDVPCGRYAAEVLDQAGVAIPTDRITRGQNAKATLAAVAAGDADAGIVYATDIVGADVEAVAIPAEVNVIADYPIAVVADAADPTSAEAFVAFVLGPGGQAILADAGFLPAP